MKINFHRKIRLSSTADKIFKAFTLPLWFFTLCAGYAGWIDPEFWALPAMLALVFLPLFLLTCIVVAAWNLYNFRAPISIIGTGVFLALIYPFMVVCPINRPKYLRDGERKLTVMTYNSFYCNDAEYENPVRSRTLDHIISTKADIVCLQELYSLDAAGTHGKATDTQIEMVKRMYPYRLEPGDRELVILSRFPMTLLSGSDGDNYFHYQGARIDVNGTPVTLLNVHLSSFGLSDDERQVMEQMGEGTSGIRSSASEMRHTIYGKLAQAFALRAEAARVVRQYADTVKGNLIVCGDFNDVPGSYAYRTIKGSDLKDLYNETGSGYTYTFNAYLMFFHIDQMLYRGNMRAVSFSRGMVRSSDHYPVLGTFELLGTGPNKK